MGATCAWQIAVVFHNCGSSNSESPRISAWLLQCVICELKMVRGGTCPGCTPVSAPASGMISRTLKHQYQACIQLARKPALACWGLVLSFLGPMLHFGSEIKEAALCTGVG